MLILRLVLVELIPKLHFHKQNKKKLHKLFKNRLNFKFRLDFGLDRLKIGLDFFFSKIRLDRSFLLNKQNQGLTVLGPVLSPFHP